MCIVGAIIVLCITISYEIQDTVHVRSLIIAEMKGS